MSERDTTRDPRYARVTARLVASSLVALALAAASGCAEDSAIRLPTRTPPTVVRTQDEKVVFQASALVELHLWLVTLATHPHLHTPPSLAVAREAYTVALRDGPTDALARATTEALGACDDLACAKDVLGPARLGDGFAGAYPWFSKNIWPLAFAHSDRALQRLRAALPDTMPALVSAIAAELVADAPGFALRLSIVHENPHFRDDRLAPLALEDSEPCLRGRREDDPEALACALFQAALALRAKSAIHARLDSSLGHDSAGRARANRLYALVAAHAVRVVTRAGSHTSRESFTASLLDSEPEVEAVLVRHWKERASAELVRALDAAASR